jgi:hypothetical protein
MHVNPDNQAEPELAADQGPSRPSAPPLASASAIPPLIAAGQAAFRSALPDLLHQRPGQWVAYHGTQQIGFARSETALYQECFRRGLKEHEFVVRCIMPEIPPETDLTPLWDI